MTHFVESQIRYWSRELSIIALRKASYDFSANPQQAILAELRLREMKKVNARADAIYRGCSHVSCK